ncbi:DUF4913 domain-containing protein [Nocardia salmonicida]|uniref:DUF4913 domain-containing protein n=1 Tax=Nocardia salmonicida TaxID=53431 RepID=UPI0037B8632B
MTTTDDTTVDEQSTPTDAQAASTVDVMGLLDLPKMIDASIKRSVKGEIDAVSKKIAKDAVKDMFTDDVVAGMLESARHQVELALNPPVEEPAEEEPQRENYYRDVVDFVDNYLGVTYRRDVFDFTPEFHWCPHWALHAEAKGRLQALWMAFEHLRQGKNLEQAQFWINYVDPTMDRLLDKNGPFRHCSISKGHKETYEKLPTATGDPRIAAVASNAGAPGSGWVQRESTVIVPSGWDTERKPREVRGFPE